MVRPLSLELQKKAIEELNEVPKRVEDDIRQIQEWIAQQPHLNAPTDKQWILGFLRGSKFSLQTTKDKIDFYYTLKNLVPELWKPKDVFSTKLQNILKAGIFLPLPYSKNYLGPRVILQRYNNFDKSSMTLEDITAFYYMLVNILMVEDDNFIISGGLLWIDMKLHPLSLILQLTPTYLKTTFDSALKALPLRIKGIVGTGSPAIAQRLLSLTKGYMGGKLGNRVSLYGKEDCEDMFKIIPKNLIPKEYGGENSSIEDITNFWIKKVESYSTYFAEHDQYCTNEALRPGKPVSFAEEAGIDGSFRKLNLD